MVTALRDSCERVREGSSRKWEEAPTWECLIGHRQQGPFTVFVSGRHQKKVGKKTEPIADVAKGE